MMDGNPFRYGDLALDDAFTDREREVKELIADAMNGQNVVLFAPRRFGKTSLMWRVARDLVRRKVLVAQVDLMRAPTKQRLAEKLARTIHDDIASPIFRAKERLRVFSGLRVTPTITVDPTDGSMAFSFTPAAAPDDIDATLERLLELPAQLAAERGRRAVLMLDEFQEIAEIDPGLPAMMRSIFQEQGDVSHIYLGSRRHMMERIFNDENEPFWRSAKRMELGPIPADAFARFVTDRFSRGDRPLDPSTVERILEMTRCHPYGTQELCYFLWEETAPGGLAGQEQLEAALLGVLRSESSHFSRIWEKAPRVQRLVLQALAQEPGRPLAAEYRSRHALPGPSSVQRALQALETDEIVARDDGRGHLIAEPFLSEWVLRNGT
jgi:uncharacterized protein